MTPAAEGRPPPLAVGVTSDRIRALTPAARAVHKVILRGFATTGQAPDHAQLAMATPAGHDLQDLLWELQDRDVVRLDEQGNVRTAYPFSAVPTAHTVTVTDGPRVWAMCAIDALGIAGMLDRDVIIDSADPGSGEPVRVIVRAGQAVADPEPAVVVVAADTTACCPTDGAGECVMSAADRCCGLINFFTSTGSAEAWLATNARASGVILTIDQALRRGIDIFGHLLDD